MSHTVQEFNQIGVAIAGTGFMGWVHAEALRRVGVRLVGVLGSSPEKSQQAAARYGADRAYDSYEELLADDAVHAVHINTPNRLHVEMATQALEAGKHVMCEKPLAMTSEESARLVEVASRHPNLAAGVNYNIRYYPLCIDARERIARGDTGDLFYVTGSYCQDWLLKATDYNWRVLAEEGGELRAVSDIGTHCLDLIQFMTGRKVVEVCADLKTIHTTRYRPKGEIETFTGKDASTNDAEPVPITTDDCGAIMLRFDDDTRGCVRVSQVAAGRKNRLGFEINGAAQTLAWHSEEPNNLWVGQRDGANEWVLRDPAAMAPAAAAASDYPGGHNEGYDDTFKQCFRAFYQAILNADTSTPAYPTFEDGHHEIVLCDAIARSARERRWIETGAAR
jgi:predicted dehydrogenase